MKSLEQLTSEDFRPLVGESFTIDGQPVTLEAVEVGEAPAPKMRAAISLVFTAKKDIGIDSDCYPVSHAAIGEHDLLVSRIVSLDPDMSTYQIILG